MSDILSIRISPELAAALKAQQEQTGCPVSEYVRRAVTAALKAEKKSIAHSEKSLQSAGPSWK